ncbi:hypothetical protein [Paenimyroides baculatum]|uniref:Uncharacterized protein n=1 Tax=Paenimyroides baculatum TaxID=2608000 RepID=A0A5M6CCM9_9FLAO|nr:hypothetical protein [Paenimyroides baculatum]KAA5532821.1 hypothetical protein F0460_13335 [Paenimyroides baculatum]
MSEREIAQQAVNKLQNAVNHNITRMFDPSGKAGGMRLNTTVKPRFNKGQMVRLSVVGPKHLYVQNYGFEGVKKNGINMRLEQTDVVNNAIESSNVVEFLAQAIGEARADEVIIQFKG